MFIANRIYEILEHSRKTEWRYVSTKENPADEGTRGLPASKIQDSSWIKGPPFLLLTEDHWPTQPTSIPIPTEPLPNLTSLYCDSIPKPTLIDYSRFSSWTKILSTTRVIFVVRNKIKNIQQTAAEINTTTQNFLLKRSAVEVFSKEKKDLQQRRSVSPKSPIISFSPVLDDANTLRSRSRLQNAPVSKNLKTPVILDARHPIVYLFNKHQHEKQGHIGVEHLRSILQQQFWIIKATVVLKKITFNCHTCRQQRQLPSQPKMADLPSVRFSAKLAVFKNVGIDYCGPYQVFSGKKPIQRYICLITCLVIRAVHLEPVTDLSTEKYLMAIDRFCSRRGNPEVIYSDNGTNCQGAANILHDLARRVSTRSIDWKFIPPGTPHQGGVWERLIGMSKRILYSIVGSKRLNDECFHTVICQVEGILNSRPLSPVSSDCKDLEALTPSHFLIGHVLQAPSTLEKTAVSSKQTKRMWKQCRECLEQFWRRLLKEYLPTLRTRSKWHKTFDQLKEGDVVWIHQNNSPRGQWPIGLVERAIRGPDGEVRSCYLKTHQERTHKPAHLLNHITSS